MKLAPDFESLLCKLVFPDVINILMLLISPFDTGLSCISHFNFLVICFIITHLLPLPVSTVSPGRAVGVGVGLTAPAHRDIHARPAPPTVTAGATLFLPAPLRPHPFLLGLLTGLTPPLSRPLP